MGTQTTHTRAELDRLRATGHAFLAVARRAHRDRYGASFEAGQCVAAGPSYWRLRCAFDVNLWTIEHVDHVRGIDEAG